MQATESIYKQLSKYYHDKKLSHAFLLETNDLEQCQQEVLNFLKLLNCEKEYQDGCMLCNLCHLIDTIQLPSLKIIEPQGLGIKKEQIIELKNAFQTKPIFSKYNMYIIRHAELLNASSANTMLKFLEEPEDNILGFFITDNKENVINTILSRCQIITYKYKEVEENNENLEQIAIDFVKEYELVNQEAILYINENLLLEIQDSKECSMLLKKMLEIYLMLYNFKLSNTKLDDKYKDLQFILKKELNYFLKQEQYIMELLNEIQYNVNYQLLLERFVLESR